MASKILAFALGLASFGCGWSAKSPSPAPAKPTDAGTDSGTATAIGCNQASPPAAEPVEIPGAFRWVSSGPLVSPIADYVHPILSVKDPSVVYFEDRFHVFATTANEDAQWNMVYLSFDDWSNAGQATQFYMNDHQNLVGYHCAPQVFYFAPQNLWYLVYQSQHPQYSTTTDITRPDSWSRPTNFFATTPAIVLENQGTGTWLDYWVICDDTNCYLFFTDDNGHLYRSRTALESFPVGFDEPAIALEGTREEIFEGSSTYRMDGTDRYLTLVEAFAPNGGRYYRSFVADTLDGEWSPLAATWENPFAASTNVTFENGNAWTSEVSHGELLRSGYDQTLTVSMDGLCFLYQGMDPAQSGVEYFRRPYRLGLLGLTD